MTGYEKSVHRVMWATCGRFETFVIVKIVVSPVPAGELMSTSKYGSSSVAAGVTPMSHESSLFVVDGPPVANVAFSRMFQSAANADPATSKVAIKAQTKVFLISISYTSS